VALLVVFVVNSENQHFRAMSQSFLKKTTKKSKSSVTRHFRVGLSPYESAKSQRFLHSKSTLLHSSSKSLSERTMDRNSKAVRKDYDGLMKGMQYFACVVLVRDGLL
jgi:hypothetical protein